MMRVLAIAATFAAALAVTSCEDPVAPRVPTPGLNLELRGDPSDTVWAPPQRIRLRALDSAKVPLVDMRVAIEVRGTADIEYGGDPELDSYVPVVTDADGVARFYIRRYSRAGSSWIIARVFSGSTVWIDSLEITALPGRPTAFDVPRDTAVYQGNTVQWRATVLDAHGNARPDASTFSAGSAGITVTGNVVAASAGPSRQLIRVASGALKDSSWLSIVPRGVIAVRTGRAAYERADSNWVYARMNLDGTGYAPFLKHTVPSYYGGRAEHPAAWLPDTSQVIAAIDGGFARLDAGLGVTPFIAAFAGGDVLRCPEVSLDGQYVYGYRVGNGNAASVWRWSAAGNWADSARISLPYGPGYYSSDACASPSPDGRYVAMTSNVGSSRVDLQACKLEYSIVSPK